VRRRVLILAPLLLIVGGVLFWRMRTPAIPAGEVPIPTGETVERVLPDAEGNPEVWTLSKREAEREEIVAVMLPKAAPRDEPPDERTDSARALDAQALEAWKAGNLEEALELFEAAVAADPDDWVPRSDYGRLLVMMTDYETAGPHLERAAELNPDSPRVWLDLYSYYQRSMQFERGFHAHERAQELADGEPIVQDWSGLWRLEGDSIGP
jgi:tetratricopeptide (TPR) repeat protein